VLTLTETAAVPVKSKGAVMCAIQRRAENTVNLSRLHRSISVWP
jgi:hypothetical protein